MPNPRDPRIDAYVRRARPFARPILAHIRKVVHRGSPRIEEAVKWGMPSYLVNGRIVCGMASFNAHAALWFWNTSGLVKAGIIKKAWVKKEGMGGLGKLTSVRDLPPAPALARAIRKAVELRKAGVTRKPGSRK